MRGEGEGLLFMVLTWCCLLMTMAVVCLFPFRPAPCPHPSLPHVIGTCSYPDLTPSLLAAAAAILRRRPAPSAPGEVWGKAEQVGGLVTGGRR